LYSAAVSWLSALIPECERVRGRAAKGEEAMERSCLKSRSLVGLSALLLWLSDAPGEGAAHWVLLPKEDEGAGAP
jgi:hypothetical protein